MNALERHALEVDLIRRWEQWVDKSKRTKAYHLCIKKAMRAVHLQEAKLSLVHWQHLVHCRKTRHTARHDLAVWFRNQATQFGFSTLRRFATARQEHKKLKHAAIVIQRWFGPWLRTLRTSTEQLLAALKSVESSKPMRRPFSTKSKAIDPLLADLLWPSTNVNLTAHSHLSLSESFYKTGRYDLCLHYLGLHISEGLAGAGPPKQAIHGTTRSTTPPSTQSVGHKKSRPSLSLPDVIADAIRCSCCIFRSGHLSMALALLLQTRVLVRHLLKRNDADIPLVQSPVMQTPALVDSVAPLKESTPSAPSQPPQSPPLFPTFSIIAPLPSPSPSPSSPPGSPQSQITEEELQERFLEFDMDFTQSLDDENITHLISHCFDRSGKSKSEILDWITKEKAQWGMGDVNGLVDFEEFINVYNSAIRELGPARPPRRRKMAAAKPQRSDWRQTLKAVASRESVLAKSIARGQGMGTRAEQQHATPPSLDAIVPSLDSLDPLPLLGTHSAINQHMTRVSKAITSIQLQNQVDVPWDSPVELCVVFYHNVAVLQHCKQLQDSAMLSLKTSLALTRESRWITFLYSLRDRMAIAHFNASASALPPPTYHAAPTKVLSLVLPSASSLATFKRPPLKPSSDKSGRSSSQLRGPRTSPVWQQRRLTIDSPLSMVRRPQSAKAREGVVDFNPPAARPTSATVHKSHEMSRLALAGAPPGQRHHALPKPFLSRPKRVPINIPAVLLRRRPHSAASRPSINNI